MASINQEGGWLMRIYPDATNAIGGEMSCDFSIDVNMISADTKDNTVATEVVPGRYTGSLSGSGLIDTGDTGFGVLQTKIRDRTSSAVEVKTLDATQQYSFTAYISNLGMSGAHDGLINWTCGITPTGEILEEAAA